MTKKEKLQVEILQKELGIIKSLPLKFLEMLDKKIVYTESQYKKFCDDMIKDNTYINRLNAAMERQKIRDYKEVADLLVKIGEKLPKLEEDGSTDRN